MAFFMIWVVRVSDTATQVINPPVDLEDTPVSVILEDGVRIARAILQDHETLPGPGAAGIPDTSPVTRAMQG